MPAPILSISAVVMCAHSGRVMFMPNAKITLSGQPAAQWTPAPFIVGCLNPPPIANTGPDVSVPLLPMSFTTKVLSNAQPFMLQTIAGIPVPSGIPLLPAISAGQIKVIAS